eukprot:5262454-Amphidinium_carterae.1
MQDLQHIHPQKCTRVTKLESLLGPWPGEGRNQILTLGGNGSVFATVPSGTTLTKTMSNVPQL